MVAHPTCNRAVEGSSPFSSSTSFSDRGLESKTCVPQRISVGSLKRRARASSGEDPPQQRERGANRIQGSGRLPPSGGGGGLGRARHLVRCQPSERGPGGFEVRGRGAKRRLGPVEIVDQRHQRFVGAPSGSGISAKSVRVPGFDAKTNERELLRMRTHAGNERAELRVKILWSQRHRPSGLKVRTW